MPIYEFTCRTCGKTSSFLERREPAVPSLLQRLLKRHKKKCPACGSAGLTRVFSTFSVSSSQSTADMLNDISKMGQVNFVPDHRPKGPPPGGCPYAQQQAPAEPPAKKVDRIKLT